MDFKKFAKYAYMLLVLFALIFTFVDAPSAAWSIWVVALLGIFVGVFGKGVEKATKIVILYLGLTVTYQALFGLNIGSFTLGLYITTFFGNMLTYMAPLVLTVISFKFIKMFKE